jgi:hypothetical protein
VFALVPIGRMVPTPITKITAGIAAYSAMSCPTSLAITLGECYPSRASAETGPKADRPNASRAILCALIPRCAKIRLGYRNHWISRGWATRSTVPGSIIPRIASTWSDNFLHTRSGFLPLLGEIVFRRGWAGVKPEIHRGRFEPARMNMRRWKKRSPEPRRQGCRNMAPAPTDPGLTIVFCWRYTKMPDSHLSQQNASLPPRSPARPPVRRRTRRHPVLLPAATVARKLP